MKAPYEDRTGENNGELARRNVYLPPEIFELASKAAKNQHRSVSNYLQFLVLQNAETATATTVDSHE